MSELMHRLEELFQGHGARPVLVEDPEGAFHEECLRGGNNSDFSLSLKTPTFLEGTIFLNWLSVNSVWPSPTLSLKTVSSQWMLSRVRAPSCILLVMLMMKAINSSTV